MEQFCAWIYTIDMSISKEQSIGIGLGLSLGLVLGVLSGNIGLWICLGLAIGAGIGQAWTVKAKSDED